MLFQSTHSRGVRLQPFVILQFALYISIHALTRSATKFKLDMATDHIISIHALTRSATRKPRIHHEDEHDFNPRTHEECDLSTRITTSSCKYFNPRTHEECDLPDCGPAAVFLQISIHALTRSATDIEDCVMHSYGISIHALTRSATNVLRRDEYRCKISIHALTRSATLSQD